VPEVLGRLLLPPKSGLTVFAGADPQAVAAARSGAAQPEAAEPAASTVSLQRFPTSTCLLRQQGGRWSMERCPLHHARSPAPGRSPAGPAPAWRRAAAPAIVSRNFIWAR
jgi:hypothetical protein